MKVKDLVAVTGKYTDSNGQEKSRYHTCGAMFKKSDGTFSIKIESLPVGGEWNGWLNLFEPRERSQQRRQQAAPPPSPTDQYGAPSLDDDIPW